MITNKEARDAYRNFVIHRAGSDKEYLTKEMEEDILIIRDYVLQLKDPTWEDVVGAWHKVLGEECLVTQDPKSITVRMDFDGYVLAHISLKGHNIFDLPTTYNLDVHNAIDLTVRYLNDSIDYLP